MHLRAPRRGDARARPDPAGRAAAADDHPRRRGHRARHRVDQLPQRAAARVGARDGRAHRGRRGRHDQARATSCSTPSPTPTARSATRPGCGSSSSRCRPYVALRHVRFDDAGRAGRGRRRASSTTRAWDGERVDGLDGVAFAPDELYLTLARWTDEPGPTSDYAGQQVFYRSLQQRATDRLTMLDYLWRWDTDWFWCSRAFGAQHPLVRRVWPRRLRRSDVYWKLVALDRRSAIGDRLDRRAGRPQGERVVQDVEVPRRAAARVPRRGSTARSACGRCGCARCGCARDGRRRPALARLPARRAGTTYVNVGFWGVVNVGPDAPASPRNRAIEAKVSELGGHKSLYSEAFYDRDEFDRLYGGADLARGQGAARPRRPAHLPLRQGGATTMSYIDPAPTGTPADDHRRRDRPAGARRAAAALHGVRRQQRRPARRRRSACTCAPSAGWPT